MALFEAQHVHKRFGDHVVLEEINLSFEENKLSGIMGPNGAGKTTCFNVLTGGFKPDRGRVIFDSRPDHRRRRADDQLKPTSLNGVARGHARVNHTP